MALYQNRYLTDLPALNNGVSANAKPYLVPAVYSKPRNNYFIGTNVDGIVVVDQNNNNNLLDFDMHHFVCEKISTQVVNGFVLQEKYVTKQDERGNITHHLTRRYGLPVDRTLVKVNAHEPDCQFKINRCAMCGRPF